MNVQDTSNSGAESYLQVSVSGEWRKCKNAGNSVKTGRAHPLFRSFVQSICLLLFTVLLLPTSASSQSPSPPQYQGHDELISALLKPNSSQKENIRALLDGHQSLVTVELWEKLVAKAVNAYHSQGLEQSLLIYDIVITVAERLKDGRRLATTYYNVGRTYAAAGKIKDAIQACLTSKKVFEEAGLRKDLIYILSELGSLHLYSQDYKQARSYAEQSIKLADALKNSDLPAGARPDDYGVALALSTLGGLGEYEGKYAEASNYFQKSLALYQGLDKGSLKYGFQIINNLEAIGRVYNAAGDNAQALIFLNQALTMSEQLPYKDRTANVLNSLGMLYLEQEDYDKAANFFTQSLKINQSLKNQHESARNLLNLGVVDQRRGNYDRALESFKTSLKQASEVSNKDVMIAAGEGIGAIYRVKGDHAAAMQVLDESLALAKEIEDQTRIAELLWRKAEVFFAIGNYSEAARLSEESLKIAHRLRFANLSFLTATLWGKALLKQKNNDLAFEVLSQAIEETEEMRDRVAGQEQEQQLFFENKVAAYRALIELSVERNSPHDALVYAERAKSRILHDIIAGGKASLTKALSDKERGEERALNRSIVDLNNQAREERLKPLPDASRLSQIQDQLHSARLKYASFQNILYASHPELKVNGKRIPTLTFDGLANLKKDAGTAFLEYVVTAERVYLFVLTVNGQKTNMDLKIHAIPIGEDALEKLVNRFRQLITTRSLDYPATSREFYDLLLKPAESQLQERSAICIIPDGILWDAPFQATLSKAGRYLIEDYSIYYAPSFNVLIEIAKRKKERRHCSVGSLLAFGNPFTGTETVAKLRARQRGESFEPLPEAETEVRGLTQIFSQGRSKIFIGAAANEKTFKRLAPTFNTIHFATHGVLDNRHPLYSYLLLAKADDDDNEDGLIEAREIMDLDLCADLVVLSACDTARGRIGAGEGVVGISWAFFAAGCRATVVSQWKVESANTSELMVHFYRYLKGVKAVGARTKADALRSAALKLIKDHRYEHPMYWAGFVMVGSND
jgi:CHAT domain-containing protein